MATFTTTIHLDDANRQDYDQLFGKLEKQVLRYKCQIIKSHEHADGKNEYKWLGNISILEITHAIIKSVPVKKFSFTIIRKKEAVRE